MKMDPIRIYFRHFLTKTNDQNQANDERKRLIKYSKFALIRTLSKICRGGRSRYRVVRRFFINAAGTLQHFFHFPVFIDTLSLELSLNSGFWKIVLLGL